MIRFNAGQWLFDYRAEGKGGSAPPPPDPYATAQAQTQTNQQTAGYNNAITHGNTTTPIGSQTYTPRVDPTTGATVYDQNISLDPKQQQLLDQQTQQNLALGNVAQGMLGQVQNAYQNGIDTSGLPGLQAGGPLNTNPTVNGPDRIGSIDTSGIPGLQGSVDFSNLPGLFGAGDLLGARKQVQDTLYNQQASYLDPQYQQADNALRTRLANQGITEGSEAWRNSVDEFNRDKERNYQSARNAAITGGGSEMSNLAQMALANRGQMANEALSAGNFRNAANQQGFGQAAARAGFQNNARDSAVSEALARAGFGNTAIGQQADSANRARAQGLQELFATRNQPLNEFNALRSASPVSMPSFGTAQNSTTNPADISGNIWNAYNGNLSAWQQQQQNNNAVLSGLFGLGSAALGKR